MNLRLMTPLGMVVEKEVEGVVLPGVLGELDVREMHTFFVSKLKEGTVRYTSGDKTASIGIDKGFVEVAEGSVTVLVGEAKAKTP